jgi:hypothetical protein
MGNYCSPVSGAARADTGSKAAMFTVLETLTDSAGMSLGELKTFYVAGTFRLFSHFRG